MTKALKTAIIVISIGAALTGGYLIYKNYIKPDNSEKENDLLGNLNDRRHERKQQIMQVRVHKI